MKSGAIYFVVVKAITQPLIPSLPPGGFISSPAPVQQLEEQTLLWGQEDAAGITLRLS